MDQRLVKHMRHWMRRDASWQEYLPGKQEIYLPLTTTIPACSFRISRHHHAMHCPACRQTLHESVPACPHCGFDLAATVRVLGAAPQLEFPLTDFTGALDPAIKHNVTEALRAMTRKFPQLRFAAVVSHVDTRIPLAAHAFWLFNLGGLSAQQEAGNTCRLVLLEFDVTNARAACMIGYGLEPFIPQDALDRIAAAALPDLQRQDVAAAIIAALQCARKEFATVAETIPRGFGLSEGGQTSSTGNEEAAFAY